MAEKKKRKHDQCAGSGNRAAGEKKYRALFKAATDAIFLETLDGQILDCNPAAVRMFGYPREEMLRLKVTDLVPEEVARTLPSLITEELTTGGFFVEAVNRRKSGEMFPVEVSSRIVHIGHEVQVVVFVRDITARKQAEEAIRTSELEKSLVLESVSHAIAFHDKDRRFLWVNKAYLEGVTSITGVPATINDLKGTECYTAWGLTRECSNCPVSLAMETGKPQEAEMTPENQKHWPATQGSWWVKAAPVRDSRGSIIGALEIAIDITARKQAAAALEAERERLAVTLRSIGDGVIATDEAGKVVLLNKAAEGMTGWSQEEAVGRLLTDVFHVVLEKTRTRCENPVERVLRAGGTVGLADNTILVSRRGAECLIADCAAPIRDRENRILGVVLAFREVTELRRLEMERLRAQKLESLGLLAGGIAHDFNNILTGILGNISLARMALQSGDDHPELLQEAEKACLRAKDLSQQLLTFAKGGAPVRQMTSLAGLVRDTVEFCLRGSNVRAELVADADLWAAEVDPGQIAQVLNNLIINSKQAMPSGGVILVQMENAGLEPGGVHPVEPGRYVRITIQDAGMGIPREYLQKVFDPFFTTKPQSSGLGLTTSYAIVRKHGGTLLLESELGVGTVVQILLPASRADLPGPAEDERPAPQGTGRVLVMDDEETVRTVAVRLLQYLGYSPMAVCSGSQAVDEYRKALESGQPFAVVILDLTVPGEMGGREALGHLQALNPAVRAIVASGYSSDSCMANYRECGFAGAMNKPFTVHEVGRVVFSVLHGR